ncbi:MAG: septal ring lytic transglycosylase RlpA family protein [Alphaproteobacteria bacterium]
MNAASACVLALLLGACAETSLLGHVVKSVLGEDSDQGQYKVGKPYQVYGVWYYPEADPDYRAEGVASWYGPGFHGLRTANGEVYDQNALTAAHKTLPMPTYVRVTNLENGRALVLRVNDRGPFVDGRLIDVSRRAAQLLGFHGRGTAKVRVEVVPPPDDAVPDGTVVAAEPAPAGGVVLASAALVEVEPLAAVAPARPAGDGGIAHIFVQAGAFGDEVRARDVQDRLASVGAAAVSAVSVNGAPLYRVRLGPYVSREEANVVLGRVWGLGLTDARLATD